MTIDRAKENFIDMIFQVDCDLNEYFHYWFVEGKTEEEAEEAYKELEYIFDAIYEAIEKISK